MSRRESLWQLPSGDKLGGKDRPSRLRVSSQHSASPDAEGTPIFACSFGTTHYYLIAMH